MEIPISTQWPQLAGYAVAGALGLQSVLSAKNGVKQVLISICGDSSLTDRTTNSESKNALSSIKSFCLGTAPLSSRTKHLKSGVEDLALAGICALVSVIVFTKGLAPRPIIAPPPVNEDDFTSEQKTYAAIFKSVKDISNAARTQIQFFHFASDYSKSPACTDYLKSSFTPSLSEMDDMQKRVLYDCYRRHILYTVGENAYTNTETVKEYIEQYRGKALELTQVPQSSSENALSTSLTVPAIDRDSVKAAALDQYRREIIPSVFSQEFNKVYNQFKPLNEKSKLRYEHFINAKMKKLYGPFVLHLDDACDQSWIEKAPFKTGYEQDCSDYAVMSRERQTVQKYKEGLDSISPDVSNTNAKKQVFEPTLNRIFSEPSESTDLKHLEYGMTIEQFEAFRELRKRYKDSSDSNS